MQVLQKQPVCSTVLWVLAWTAVMGAVQEPSESPVPTLASIFEQGAILEDRNGDGVTDFVNVRFVLGDPPSASDVAAAANVAARLGFESMAINLPLADAAADAPIVAIGAGSVRAGRPGGG